MRPNSKRIKILPKAQGTQEYAYKGYNMQDIAMQYGVGFLVGKNQFKKGKNFDLKNELFVDCFF